MLILGGVGCSVPGTPTEEEDFLPVFSNSSDNVAGASHTFDLRSNDDYKPSGTFSGNEYSDRLEIGEVSGTFVHSICQFTITRDGVGVTYNGKFLKWLDE